MEYKIKYLNELSAPKLTGVEIYQCICADASAYGTAFYSPVVNGYVLEINCSHGFLTCGIFRQDFFETKGIPAAIFAAARPENIMESKPVFLSTAAMAMGATSDMTGAELMQLFS